MTLRDLTAGLSSNITAVGTLLMCAIIKIDNYMFNN